MSCLRLSNCLFKFRSDEVYERNQPRFQVYFYNNNNEFQQHCMSKSLLRNTTRTHVSFSNKNNNNHFLDNDLIEEEEEEEDRKLVHCEVEVISWRERRIKAQISIHAHIQSVWNALTDYERLADYIPNLVSRFLLYYLLLYHLNVFDNIKCGWARVQVCREDYYTAELPHVTGFPSPYFSP